MHKFASLLLFFYNCCMDGFFLVDKPSGFTSRDICDQISKSLKEKKVGHVGTLDPFATGLLIVMVGKGTKCAQFFDESDKAYIAKLVLGKKTDSLDRDGEVIEEKEVPILTKEKVEETLKSFLGKQKQTPPMTSAVHVNGKKLYEYAHKGIEVERPSREIEILDLKLLEFNNNEIIFFTHVSKGTYIRVLASDIAERLNTVGYLEELRRVNVGPFDIKEAVPAGEIGPNSIKSVVEILGKFCYLKVVDGKTSLDIKNGKILELELDIDNTKLLIIDVNNNPVAMYTKNNKGKFVFARGLF